MQILVDNVLKRYAFSAGRSKDESLLEFVVVVGYIIDLKGFNLL